MEQNGPGWKSPMCEALWPEGAGLGPGEDFRETGGWRRGQRSSLEGCGELEALERWNQVRPLERMPWQVCGRLAQGLVSRSLKVEATVATGLSGGCGAGMTSLGGGWDEAGLARHDMTS